MAGLLSSRELLDRATEFDAGNPVHLNGVIFEDDDEVEPHHHLYIRLKHGREDDKPTRKWAIYDGKMTLGQDGKWEYESIPSNRKDDYLRNHRFSSLEDAFIFLDTWKKEELARAIKEGFKTWKQKLIDNEKQKDKKHVFDAVTKQLKGDGK